MLDEILKFLIPMVIHFGVNEVLSMHPEMPEWLRTVLLQFEGAKSAAAQLPKAEAKVALNSAVADVYKACSGVACPPQLKGFSD